MHPKSHSSSSALGSEPAAREAAPSSGAAFRDVWHEAGPASRFVFADCRLCSELLGGGAFRGQMAAGKVAFGRIIHFL